MEEMDEKLEQLLSLIRSNKSNEEIKNALEHYHDSDIADAIPLLNKDERKKLYSIIGIQATSDVFTYLDDVEDYVDELENDKVADIIELMDADDAVDILEELDEEDQKEIVRLMDNEAVEDIKMISSYDETQVGSRMTTNYIVVSKDLTIKEVMKTVVNEAPENDNIGTIYVVDENDVFYGSIDLKDLIIARSNDELSSIIRTNYPFLKAEEKFSDCLNDLKEYTLDMIPVLDDNQHLVGVITSSDLVEAIDDEMGDDYAKLAGLTDEEEMNEPLKASLRKRLPWLALLLFLGLCVSLIISQFETIIAVIPVIVFFQSTVLDMAGNVGTQSLAVTIRSLVDDDKLERKTVWKMIFKEVRVGFINGLVIGSLAFLVVFLFLLIKHQPISSDVFVINEALLLSSGVYISLIVALTLASFLGTSIPVLLKRLKFDPAVASGPLITTLNDIVAIISYYGLCMLLFNIL